MSGDVIEIFLVEDNDGDVFLARKAFEKLTRPYRITVANDGETALRMLRKEGEYQETPHPHLIFLDINLPGKDGKRVLLDIKNDENLRRVPVIVLSSSKAEHDILQVYNDLASAYICKPNTIDDFRNIVAAVDTFWFGHCILPKR